MLVYKTEFMGKSFDFQYWYIYTLKLVPHIHEFCEVIYCMDGTMTMYLDGQKLTVPQGHIVFIFPNHIHEVTVQTPFNAWCAVFSRDFLQPFFSLYPDRYPRDPVLDMTGYEELIQHLQKTDPDQRVRLTGLLHLLFSILLQETELVEQDRPDTSPYMTALNYVAQNYRSNISLASMAKELGYHEKYLSAVLHGLTKMHFRDFLASYRVEYVKKQLTNSTDPISQIAMDAGFASINTFNKVFKKFTGIAPTDYRKLQQ